MARAYLLASVLTLIVVLVHGQEAFPERDKIVEVVEDRLEDELETLTDLILSGSANPRDECIQRKKCRNKGGTCQKTEDPCQGTFTKGCIDGCSCCLPEGNICKPSSRCKEENGECIPRKSKCQGKTIRKGCRSPSNCKRTHVCCVPSCSSNKFEDDHVCKKCDNSNDAMTFVKDLTNVPDDTTEYLVFADKDDKGDEISFIASEGNCNIKKPVQAWMCKRKDNEWKKCTLQGFCTANVYIPGSIKCLCPSKEFEDDHVCETCDSPEKARTFVEQLTNVPDDTTEYLVFAGKDDKGNDINFIVSKGNCEIKKPVQAWSCKREDKEWKECTLQEFCRANVYIPGNIKCICPTYKFRKNHVCGNCKNSDVEYRKFMDNLKFEPKEFPYPVFAARTFNDKKISYSRKDNKWCSIEKPVLTWTCEPKGNKWSCKVQGFCIADSIISDGSYKTGSLYCDCPNPFFKKKHVCKGCIDPADALKHTNKNRKEDAKKNMINTVLAIDKNDNIVYNPNGKICEIESPKSLKAWDCDTIKKNNKWVWNTCKPLGLCNNLLSRLNDGHFEYKDKKCDEGPPKMIWNDDCDTLKTFTIDDTHASCMEKCRQETGCNAVNYKFGEFCILMACTIPYPDPTNNTAHNAYFLFPETSVP